ncbi:chromosome segregation protein Csm1/Pcs1-domain-containing protein [Phyllosticta citricarpa]|uniref:Chromosome segregation protein Csm1/Pcs1-domain-containing protein n=1 Tax=Phyllosticta citricarpa TaxID=55181 RepID=A0ABR1M628_9PEZI
MCPHHRRPRRHRQSPRLLSHKIKVLLAGRTESTLAASAREIGAAGYYVLDVGDTGSVAPFIARVTAEHAELDCVINNAGVQRPLDVQREEPAGFLDKADNEIDIDFKGPLLLTIGLLPHLRERAKHGAGAAVVDVIASPFYNGTKAWLHFWSTNLRTQQRGTRVRVIEIAPPTVAMDLHREREDPDDNKKEKNPGALSVDEFVFEVGRRLLAGADTIGAGMSAAVVERWYKEFRGRTRRGRAFSRVDCLHFHRTSNRAERTPHGSPHHLVTFHDDNHRSHCANMPPKRAAAATISNLVDDSASEDEFARNTTGMMVSESTVENAAPVTKGAKGRPKKNATAKEASATTTRARTTARRASGGSVVAGKAKVSKAKKPGPKRKALAERPEPNGSDTEEVDDFDQPQEPVELARAKPKARGRPPKAKAAAAVAEPEVLKKPGRGRRAPKKEEEPVEESIHVIPETQPEPDHMDVEPSIEEIPETQQPEPARRQNTRGRAGSRQPQQSKSYRPAASASETEKAGGDPALRRKLGDMTKKLENLDLKYQTLRDVGMRDAESNFDRLKKSADERAKAQDDLIASLKKELATQRAQATESKALKSRVKELSAANEQIKTEHAMVQDQLSEAEHKIETLNAKLSAKVAEAKVPGSAVKSHRTATAGGSESALIQQLKEDLYTDITGLIIRGVKREEDEDVFDCIQTGRNGTLHFHLAIESSNKASSQSYEDAEFAYVPLLDENRDSQLLEILPDYLTEEICFPRNNAAKFYSKIAECLTKRIVDE